MRTSDDRLQCSRCLSRIQLILTFPAWVERASFYIERIAIDQKWDVVARLCPACKAVE